MRERFCAKGGEVVCQYFQSVVSAWCFGALAESADGEDRFSGLFAIKM
jgi:hypothetical protein